MIGELVASISGRAVKGTAGIAPHNVPCGLGDSHRKSPNAVPTATPFVAER